MLCEGPGKQSLPPVMPRNKIFLEDLPESEYPERYELYRIVKKVSNEGIETYQAQLKRKHLWYFTYWVNVGPIGHEDMDSVFEWIKGIINRSTQQPKEIVVWTGLGGFANEDEVSYTIIKGKQ